MKPTKVGDSWARFDDGTCWALPDETLEYTTRYGNAEPRKLEAASALNCYSALIALPERERNRRVRALRAAMAMRDKVAENARGTK